MKKTSKINNFKVKAVQQNVLGFFSKTTDSSMIEASINSGMDFVILDMEHGPITTETLKHHLMAVKDSNMLPIVRVDAWDSELIEKSLDLGALGIQVPSVNHVKHARGVIDRAKFHPLGNRGVCRFVRAADYANQNRFEYFEESNSNLVILQLEGVEGVDAFEQIIEVEGVDIIFIGPYDLSQSVGFPGQLDHPEVLRIMQNLIEKAKDKNILLGTFCDTKENMMKWKNLGIKYLAYSVDITLFVEKLQELNKFRNEV